MNNDLNKYNYKRGEVFKIDFSDDNFIDHEQQGNRLGVIIQNDKGNKHCGNVIIALASSKRKSSPTHFSISDNKTDRPTTIMTEHIRTVSKRRLYEYVCTLDADEMKVLDEKLKLSLSLQ